MQIGGTMLTMSKRISVALCALALLSLPVFGKDKQPPPPLPANAPAPEQIVAGKKVFLSNAGSEGSPNINRYNGGPNLHYNLFYAAMKSWGHYEITPAPADADLIFEISFADPIVGINTVSGGAEDDPQFRLRILDLKTHTLLWTIIEHVQTAKNFNTELNEAMDQLV